MQPGAGDSIGVAKPLQVEGAQGASAPAAYLKSAEYLALARKVKAEEGERLHSVGGEEEAGAQRLKAFGALKQCDAVPVGGQGRRRQQPAPTTATALMRPPSA